MKWHAVVIITSTHKIDAFLEFFFFSQHTYGMYVHEGVYLLLIIFRVITKKKYHYRCYGSEHRLAMKIICEDIEYVAFIIVTSL